MFTKKVLKWLTLIDFKINLPSFVKSSLTFRQPVNAIEMIYD